MSRPRAALCSPDNPGSPDNLHTLGALRGPETRRGRRTGRQRRALPIFLLAGLLAGACAEGRSPLELAREAADDGDRARAIGMYQQHLQQSSDDFEARLEYTLLLGELWAFRGGDRAPIVESLELLYDAQPDNLRVKELYAMMLVREGQAAGTARRFEDAERHYQRALDVHPDVGTPSYHLGVMYQNQGRGEAAFQAYIAAALKRPPIPDLYLRLGRDYLARGDLDRAINTLQLVDELRGTSTYLLPAAHCALAEAYHRRDDDDTARDHLARGGEDCTVAGLS